MKKTYLSNPAPGENLTITYSDMYREFEDVVFEDVVFDNNGFDIDVTIRNNT